MTLETVLLTLMTVIAIVIFLVTFFFVPKWTFQIIKSVIVTLWEKKYRLFSVVLCASMIVGILGLVYSGLAFSCVEDTDILVDENNLLQDGEKTDGIYDSYADYIAKDGMSGKEVSDYLEKADAADALESYKTYMKYAKSIKPDFKLEKEEYENHLGTVKNTIKVDAVINKIKPIGGIRLDDIVGRYIYLILKSVTLYMDSTNTAQRVMCWLGVALIMFTMVGVIILMTAAYGIVLEWPVLLVAFVLDSIIKAIKLPGKNK